MIEFRISTKTAEARRQLSLISAGFSDMRGFWPMVVPLTTSWWRRMFETEGAFAGTPWPALSPGYAAWKSVHYPGKPILQRTGQTKQAAWRPERRQTPTTLTLTIDDTGPAHGPVLQYHQEGDGVPERRVVFGDPLPPVAAVELTDVADRYVRELLTRVLGPAR